MATLSLQRVRLASVCFALISYQLLIAGFLPFSSTVVQPSSFIIQVEQASWVDSLNHRFELLDQPLQVDIMKTDSIDLSHSLQVASTAGFVPLYLELCIKRQFQVIAEATLASSNGDQAGQEVRLHTQAGLPGLAIGGVHRLSLAASGGDAATPQSSYFPCSEAINSSLASAHIQNTNDLLTYQLQINPSWLNQGAPAVWLKIISLGIEFGDSPTGAPYFMVPYLPANQLLQATEATTP